MEIMDTQTASTYCKEIEGPLAPKDLQTSTDSAPQTLSFQFTGQAGEYFRIWIVNLLLTVVTLGIYSAWATVRTRKYFYAHTRLGGLPFEFTAEPMPILKGRLIVGAFLIFWGVMMRIAPATIVLFYIAMAFIAPWAIVKSMAFRLRYTSYRNVPFFFEGTYGEAFMVFSLSALLIILSLGFATPYVMREQHRFLITKSGFGDCLFSFTAKTKPFFSLYFKTLGMCFLCLLVPVIIITCAAISNPEFFKASPALQHLSLFGVYGILFLFVAPFFNAKIRNLVFSHMVIKQNQLHCNLSWIKLVGLMFTGAIACVFTLGMLYPWFKIRLTRFYWEGMSMTVIQPLESFTAEKTQKQSALGNELGEAFDLGIGF